MSTTIQTKETAMAQRKWYVVDASDIPVGRLATEVATLLRGKHKPTFVRHNDGGDFVVVINAKNLKLTGNKAEGKLYQWHTNYPGGVKEVPAGRMLEKHPDRIITEAVKGMLPDSKLAEHMLTKLKVYAGAEHPHKAQSPEVYTVKGYNRNRA